MILNNYLPLLIRSFLRIVFCIPTAHILYITGMGTRVHARTQHQAKVNSRLNALFLSNKHVDLFLNCTIFGVQIVLQNLKEWNEKQIYSPKEYGKLLVNDANNDLEHAARNILS